MDQERFIFRDPQGRRWKMVSSIAIIFTIVLILSISAFVHSLFLLPHLQSLPKVMNLDGLRQAGSPPAAILPQAPREWLLRRPINNDISQEYDSNNSIRLGFLDSYQERALQSLSRNSSSLTHLAPMWLKIHGLPPQLEILPHIPIVQKSTEKQFKLIPILTNLVGENYDPEAIEHFLHADIKTQRNFAEELRNKLQTLKAHGVLIAWEQVDPTYHLELTEFISQIKTVLSAYGLELWLNIPVGDDIKIFDLEPLSKHVDRFVATLYYETGENDPPGAISSFPWFRRWLDALVKYGNPHQWIIGLGTFGYDWAKGDSETIAFYDAMARARSAGVTQILNLPPYNGPSFTYREGTIKHTVWFLDAITFRQQMQEVLQHKLGGIAIDRLGSEDPAIWEIIKCGVNCKAPNFQTIASQDFVAIVGQGDFLQVDLKQIDGWRNIIVAANGNWSTNYEKFPSVPTVTRTGNGQPNQIAITFDDGPHPQWTPKILDILQQHKVKATFFVMGVHAIAYPALIKRILAEGHTLGNHTFNHPDLRLWDQWRIRLELNATQRAIETITGRSTLLFRPPYDADRSPHTVTELKSLVVAQELGYISAMASIDPLDWDRPSPEEMLQRIKLQRSRGRVILLHDGGNDRSNTVQALSLILDYLQKRGDEIVPLHKLLNTTKVALNPAIPASDPVPQRVVAGTGLNLLRWLGKITWYFLIVATGLLMLRTLFIVIIALVRAWYERMNIAKSVEKFSPPISILIAAYNEETVIANTLNAVLISNYAGEMEIVVVDDGSLDRTANIVTAIAATDTRVRLVRQANLGKATALQVAITQARYPFIAMLDADTQFLPNTLQELVQPLYDAKVGAVSANIKVGNTDSWISRFQALEYLASFNLDRRAYGIMEAIPVVPGAASAYRVSAITAAGGIHKDTLAEDTDLTLAMHKAGFKIRHAATAQAITEAPRKIKALLRQRQRWSFGTLQCLWKHRNLLFNADKSWLGWFVLPSTWFFHIFLVAIAPLIDIALILALLYGADNFLIMYVAIFMCIDVLLALIACALEGETLTTAWLVIPMRILYRPLLSLAVLSALKRALRGAWVSWGIQERLGLNSKLGYKKSHVL